MQEMCITPRIHEEKPPWVAAECDLHGRRQRKTGKYHLPGNNDIGIRRQKMDRTVLRRSKKTVQTPYGEAEVKICEKDGMKKVYPEYESVVRLCKESGAAFQDVFESVKLAIEK